jgi:hypothetical protein
MKKSKEEQHGLLSLDEVLDLFEESQPDILEIEPEIQHLIIKRNTKRKLSNFD